MNGADPRPLDSNHPSRATYTEITASILLLLDEDTRNITQIRRDLAERTAGGWQPELPELRGYLGHLRRDGHLQTIPDPTLPGAYLYELTDTGRAHVQRHRQEWDRPWLAVGRRFRPAWAEAHEAWWRWSSVYRQLSQLPDLPPQRVHEIRVAMDQAARTMWQILLEATADSQHPRQGTPL